MVAGDQDDRSVGNGFAKPLNLTEREHDRGVAGSYGMEEVAGDDHGVGASGNHAIDRGAEGLCHVGLALIDTGRCLTVVLTDAEVSIGDVGEFHSRNVS